MFKNNFGNYTWNMLWRYYRRITTVLATFLFCDFTLVPSQGFLKRKNSSFCSKTIFKIIVEMCCDATIVESQLFWRLFLFCDFILVPSQIFLKRKNFSFCSKTIFKIILEMCCDATIVESQLFWRHFCFVILL